MTSRSLPYALAAVAMLVSSACGGELIADGASGGSDAAGADGNNVVSALLYRPHIQSDLESAGCAASACHGGDSVPMRVVAGPASESEWRDNYNQVSARVGTASSSLLLDKAMGAGGHLAAMQNGDESIERWRDWIGLGAPFEDSPSEPDGGAASGNIDAAVADAGSGGADLTWTADVAPIMNARCVRCHGTLGAYSLESYTAALGFGTDGIPNVVPGDATSLLAQYSEQGHQGITAPEALIVTEWIITWQAIK